MPNSIGFFANSTVTSTRISVYLCPSDPNAGNLAVIRPADSRMDTLDVSYVASAGTTTTSPNNTAPDQYVGDAGAPGLFWWYKSYGLNSCLDGTSNTVAYSEALVTNGGNEATARRRPSPTPTRGTRSTGVGGAAARQSQQYDANQNPTAIITGLNACSTAFANKTGLSNLRGVFWEVGSLGMTMFNTIAPPNSKQWLWGDCRNTGGGYPNDATFANTSSLHAGGVNCLMGDGDVRFVEELAIAYRQNTWWALGTRANNEVIDASSY